MRTYTYVMETEAEISRLARLWKDGFINSEELIEKLREEVLRLEQLLQD